MTDLIGKHVPEGPATRTFLDGSRYWVIDLPSVRIGQGHFKPDWVWSQHAGPQTGRPSAAHIGYIVSGAMAIVAADGSRVELGPGDAFEVGPQHDAWVIGDQTCVALDLSMRTAA